MTRRQSTPAKEPELPPSTMVGEYRLDSKYAAGSMGTIYQAHHPVIGKKVAVKVLRSDMSRVPRLVERFVNEARAVNRIGHPNIVDIFSFGTLPDGRSFFVMEWLDGLPLDTRLAQGEMSPLEVLRILDQLADALATAHAAGVVHCDMKPANVMIALRSHQPFTKLLDFGIAQLGASEKDDAPRRLSGTPAYMAPEQITLDDVSPATDVYALGTIAYEMFLHQMPYSGSNIRELLQAKLSEPPPSPSSLQAHVPLALEELIMNMLAKDPDERPSLKDVRQEFGRLERAFLLSDSITPHRFGRHRPVLQRWYVHIDNMVRPMLAELSSRVAWTEASGPVPEPGTPVVIRFTAARYGITIDLGALVEHQLGTESQRSLLQYDPISPDVLAQIISVAGMAQTVSEEEEDKSLWLDEVPPNAREDDLDLVEAAPTDALAVPLPRSSESQVVLPMLEDPEPSEGRDVFPTMDLERSSSSSTVWGGLGAKVTALTLSVTVLAVVGVVVIALVRVQADRAYYFEELALRTAMYVQDSVKIRLQSRLNEVEALSNHQIDTVRSDGMIGLLTCLQNTCTEAAGQIKPAQHQYWKHTPPGRRVRRTPAGILLSHRRGDRGALLWLEPEALLLSTSVPHSFSLRVDHESAGRLFIRGKTEDELPKDIRSASQPGGRRLLGENGEEWVAAWSSATPVQATVMIEARIATEAVFTLAQRSLGVLGILLLVAGVLALIFSRGLTRRLRRLTLRATEVAQGRFVGARELEGPDEVGQLARSFSDMSQALRDRDREVLRIRREMTQQDTRAAQRRWVDELQNQLVSTLDRMASILTSNPSSKESVREFRRRETELEVLVKDAMASTQRAVMAARIGQTRVDFASVVADAVDYCRSNLKRGDVRLAFEAPNAVFFPQVEARESELREIVAAIVETWAEQARSGDRADVTVRHEDQRLLLWVSAPKTERLQDGWRDTLRQLTRVITSHQALTRIQAHEDFVSVVLGFKVPSKDNAAP